MALVLTREPARILIAVHAHRIIGCEDRLRAAQAEVALARAEAHRAGISPRHMKAALSAMKRRGSAPLAPEVQAIVDAVDAVPMGDVEVLGDGALSLASPRRPLSAR